MAQLFFFIILLAMLPFAFLSLIFASRNWYGILWNGCWYLVLGSIAVKAFNTPMGKYVGAFFMVLYLIRIIKKPSTAMKFEFHHFRRGNPFSRPHPRGGERIVSEVLPGEFERLDSK